MIEMRYMVGVLLTEAWFLLGGSQAVAQQPSAADILGLPADPDGHESPA